MVTVMLLVSYIAFPIWLARIMALPFVFLPRIIHALIVAGLTVAFWLCLLGVFR